VPPGRPWAGPAPAPGTRPPTQDAPNRHPDLRRILPLLGSSLAGRPATDNRQGRTPSAGPAGRPPAPPGDCWRGVRCVVIAGRIVVPYGSSRPCSSFSTSSRGIRYWPPGSLTDRMRPSRTQFLTVPGATLRSLATCSVRSKSDDSDDIVDVRLLLTCLTRRGATPRRGAGLRAVLPVLSLRPGLGAGQALSLEQALHHEMAVSRAGPASACAGPSRRPDGRRPARPAAGCLSGAAGRTPGGRRRAGPAPPGPRSGRRPACG
jgi:hypothetical protein